MIRRLKKSLRGFAKAFGPASPRDRWLKSMEGIATIHHTTVFNDRQPDDALVKIGKGSYFEPNVTIWLSSDRNATPNLSIGQRVLVTQNCYIGAYQPITIGNDVLIGAYTYIISGNHRFDRRDIPIPNQGFTGAPIVIADEAWIGAHVMILPGVIIGKGAIVGAGSVVTKSIPPYQIWAGNPAQFLKERRGT